MGQKRGKGKAVKKARSGLTASEGLEAEFKKAPHSFVFSRGQVGKNVTELISDMRRVMQPYTAEKLQKRKKNVLKDFVSVAGVLNVTHFLIFTKTNQGPYLKVCRVPHGPTLTFKVESYALARDVITSIKRHHMEPRQFQSHPLMVLNAFSGEGKHMKLMATMLQNMFPSINVTKVNLNNIRRTVIFNYNAETETIDFRHYNIRSVPLGASRGVKKILKAKVPNLGKLEEFSDFLTKGGGDLSESEAELDGDHNTVTLPQNLSSRGNIEHGKSAIRLTEIGPRLTLKLLKIEEGLCDGDVLYHSFVSKTEEELAAQKAERMRKKQEKAQRKKMQEENISLKEAKKDAHKQKSLAGMKRKAEEEGDKEEDEEEPDEVDETEDPGKLEDGQEDEMDDAAYFAQEVGEKPEPELFPTKATRLKRLDGSGKKATPIPAKKRKLDKGGVAQKDGKDKKKGGKDEGKGKKKGKERQPLTELDKIRRRKMRADGPKKRDNRRGPKRGNEKAGKDEQKGKGGEMGFKKGGETFSKGRKSAGKPGGKFDKGGKKFDKGGKKFDKGGKGSKFSGKNNMKGGKGRRKQ